MGVQTLAHLRNSGQIEPIVGSFLHLTWLSQGTQNPSLHRLAAAISTEDYLDPMNHYEDDES